jgi:formate dehydrogenase maturation protein FdhE
MSLQNVQAAKVAVAELWAHYCAACAGAMKLVMATPNDRRNGARFYDCEYVCDCGYREIFEEVL